MHPTTLRLQDKIAALKEKPQHVRENIAIFISGGLTLIVFLGWAGSMANSDTFTFSSATATSTMESPLAKASESKDSVHSLLGAASAALNGDTTSPPHIEIVDSGPVQTAPAPEQTVIHF